MKINWGTSIVIFFVLFLSLATAFIIFSFQHKNDLVTDDYYQQGANYDVQMQIDKRSMQYKDSFIVENQGSAISIRTSQAMAQRSEQISVWFYSPSNKKNDFSLVISSNPMVVDKKQLAHGRYIVKLRWMMGGEQYMLSQDLFVD